MTLLVTVISRLVTCKLSTSPGVPGPHDLTVRRPRCSSCNAAHVHRIPPRVRDDAYAPLVEAGRVDHTHLFTKNGRKIFLARRLDKCDFLRIRVIDLPDVRQISREQPPERRAQSAVNGAMKRMTCRVPPCVRPARRKWPACSAPCVANVSRSSTLILSHTSSTVRGL